MATVLEQHELIKIQLLETAPGDRYELAEQLAKDRRAALVQVIGRNCAVSVTASDRPTAQSGNRSLPDVGAASRLPSAVSAAVLLVASAQTSQPRLQRRDCAHRLLRLPRRRIQRVVIRFR